MIDNFLYSLNAILPIFLTVLVGWIIKKTGFLSDKFFSDSERFVFKIALPCMLFLEVATGDVDSTVDLKLIGFCCAGITLSVILLLLTVPLAVKDNAARGAIIQGSYRSNFAVLGVPLAASMFGEGGASSIAVLMPFVIILFNVYAVIILSLYAPEDRKKPPGAIAADIIRSVITNPLIIAVVLGLPFLYFDIELPAALSKTISGFSGTVTALALMSLGAGFTFSALRGKLGWAISGTLIKTVLLPAGAVCVGLLCGFREIDLGLIFILFGSPSAISSYIMAKNMGSDSELAGQVLLLTTVFCLFTIFIGIFILRSASLI